MKIGILVLAIGVGLMLLRQGETVTTESEVVAEMEWPEVFEGRGIVAMELSPQEEVFAKGFPGALAKFIDEDGREIILRHVTQATRKLHPTSDCLRASGYSIGATREDRGWKCYEVRKGGAVLAVREQIRELEGEQTWTEVSEWWWEVSSGGSEGGWLAVTVIEEKKSEN